jgi:hypothetical protein
MSKVDKNAQKSLYDSRLQDMVCVVNSTVIDDGIRWASSARAIDMDSGSGPTRLITPKNYAEGHDLL